MKIKEIKCKTLLRNHKEADSWFLIRYGMNLYRGCEHACEYCDGKAEKYQTQDDFGECVYVKINAPEIFKKELKKYGFSKIKK